MKTEISIFTAIFTNSFCPISLFLIKNLKLLNKAATGFCLVQFILIQTNRKKSSDLHDLVRLKGLEPPTFAFVVRYSIQLSYKRISSYDDIILFVRITKLKIVKSQILTLELY